MARKNDTFNPAPVPKTKTEPSSEPEKPVKLSRRGKPRYDTNPSIQAAIANTKRGIRRIGDKSGTRFMVVSDDGEIRAPAGFHEVVEVDKTQFLKLYVSGVRAFQGLSQSGAKVFEVLAHMMHASPKKDRFYMNLNTAQEYMPELSRTTFNRGMSELIDKEFIYESTSTNMYFLNINYVFSGNRLAFIKDVRVKGTEEQQQLFEDLPALEE